MTVPEKLKFKFNARPLVVVFLSLFLALVSAHKLLCGDGVTIALVVSALVIALIYIIFRRKFIYIALIVVAFGGGIGLHVLTLNDFLGKEYSSVQICGRVVEKGTTSGGTTYLILHDVTAAGNPTNGVDVYVSGVSENVFNLGDIVVYDGDLTHQKMFDLGSFNSRAYRDKSAYVSYASSGNILISPGWQNFDEKARLKIKQTLYDNMDEKYASVAYAVLTGAKEGIDSQLYDAFRDAGIVHLLAVSGLHITFLTTLIAWVLKRLRVNKYVNFCILFVALIIYAFICGFAPSVVRASIMGLMLSLATILGQKYDGPNALATAGILTLLIFPLSAMDIGFLMSYGCVAGIFMLNRPTKKVLSKFIPPKIAEYLAISISAQVGILPSLAALSETFNLLTIFSNLIVIPLFSVLFPLLIVSTLVVLAFPSFGVILKASQWGFMAIEQVAIFFASTRLKVKLTKFSPFYTTFLYGILFICSYYLFSTPTAKWLAVLICSLCMCLVTMFAPAMAYRGTSVYVFGNTSSPVMVLESSTGQTLSIGYDTDRMNALFENEHLDHIDYVLSPSEIDGGALSIVTQNEGYAGAFSYKKEDEIYIIEFDGVKILFTNLSRAGYNNSRISSLLSSGDFDFVCATGYEQAGNYFLANKSGENADFSLHKDGSLKYVFETGKAWRID